MTDAESTLSGVKPGFLSPDPSVPLPFPKPFRVQAAALPWRRVPAGLQVMLITSRGSGRWVIPKGWPEDGEACRKAAAREAGEEAGIFGAVAPREIGRYDHVKRLASGALRRCRVRVFPMEILRLRAEWPERSERLRAWFEPDEAAMLVREPDLAALIRRFAANPALHPA